MKHAFCLVLSILMLIMLSNADAAPTTFYVAPNGNNEWSGTLDAPNADGTDGPFAAISGARDRLRLMRGAGALPGGAPITVLVRDGVYSVAEPIVFTPEDSGTEDAPVRYQAYPGESPVLHGGKRITEWRVSGPIWVTDLPEAFRQDGYVSSFWVNGVRRDPARFPKATHAAGDYPSASDFFYTEGPVMDKNPDTGEETKSNTRFQFQANSIQPWEHLDGAVFTVFHSWATSLHRVKQVDWDNRIIEFTGPARWPFTYWKKEQWYFVEHLLEALDTPGDWCLNRKDGTLHYYPQPGETPENVDAVIPVARQLLVLQGEPDKGKFVSHLIFAGIKFNYTDWPVGAAGHSDAQAEVSVEGVIQTVGARNCLFQDCEVAHVGGYGVWFRRGSQHNKMERCALMDLGAGGVRIGEMGDPAAEDEAVSHIQVDNCILHDGGRIYRSAVGVWIGRSSYNTISHNEICDFRYSGVSVGWSWGYDPSSANHNIIEFNHIHNLGKGQLSDMGGIYTLGVSPGTILRNNYIHDILSNPDISGGWGLYTDEGSTDILLTNNIVCNTRTGGFHQHYGKENRVVNNIFAFSQREQLIRSRDEEHVSFFFDTNIVYYDNGQLLGSTWKNGNFVLNRNCYWDASGAPATFAGKSFDEWKQAGFDMDSINADPGFADIARRDFSLKPDSPACALGFQPIDPAQAGPQGDEAWVNRARNLKRIPAPEYPQAK